MDLDGFLRRYVGCSVQHQTFYHFTDKQNVDSIKKHGLLSTRALREKDLLDGLVTGGDEISLRTDIQNGTDAFVRLCFTQNHPMAYVAANDHRQREFIYLPIAPEIIKLPGVLVTNAPSNQAGVVPIEAATALDEIDLSIIYTKTDWTNPVFKNRLDIAEKYEILVPDAVPLRYITIDG